MDIREQMAMEVGAARHPWERARLAVVERLLRRTSRPELLVDVGCGDAYVLDALAARWPEVRCVGVDPAAEPRREGAEILQSLDALAVAPGAVSHVLLLDVLEHVEDDLGLLEEVLGHPAVSVRRRGEPVWVLVTVPAHPRLMTAHDRALGHHRRYSRSALLRLLDRAGLTVVEEGGLFASLLVPRAGQRLWERALRRNEGTSGLTRWRGGRALTSLIERALVTDFQVSDRLRRAGRPLPGLSHYALCHF